MYTHRKERYDYTKGNYKPGDHAPSPVHQPDTQPDLEAQQPDDAGTEKKKNSKGCCAACCGCCCRCCCWCFLIILILLIFLAIAGVVLFPKKPNVKLLNIDINKGAVYEVRSDNKYDIEIDNLYGELFFKGESIVEFNAENMNIKKKATTKVEIPLKPQLSKQLLTHCLVNNEFEADMDVNVKLKLLKWLGKPIHRKEKIKIPCPKLPDAGKIPADLMNKIPDDANQSDIAKLTNKQ